MSLYLIVIELSTNGANCKNTLSHERWYQKIKLTIAESYSENFEQNSFVRNEFKLCSCAICYEDRY